MVAATESQAFPSSSNIMDYACMVFESYRIIYCRDIVKVSNQDEPSAIYEMS